MESPIHFLRPHLQHIKVPRPGVELELQLPAYTTAMATLDLSSICDLQGSLWQCDPLNNPRDQTHIFAKTMSGP